MVHRGHSRNLSSSSITSMTSVSTFGGDEHRHHTYESPRPNRLSLDTFVPTSTLGPAHTPSYYQVGGNSPTGYSTPNSASFSMTNSSPRFNSGGLQSPASHLWSNKTPSRRLSIPGSNAFQSSHSPDTYPSSYANTPPSAVHRHHRNSSQLASAASSHSPSMRASQDADDAYSRRRTWHPNTQTQLRGLPSSAPPYAQHITDLPRPIFPQLQQQHQQSSAQMTRLPGITSFDQPPPPPTLFGVRPPSPMQLDQPPTSHPIEAQPAPVSESTRNRISWTSSIQSGIKQLAITNEQKLTRESWFAPHAPPAAEPALASRPNSIHVVPSTSEQDSQQEQPPTPRRNKRMGWYMQPPALSAPAPAAAAAAAVLSVPTPATERPSPDSVSSEDAPTPVSTATDHTPAIIHSNGHVETTQAMSSGPLPAIEEMSKLVPQPTQPPQRQYEFLKPYTYVPPAPSNLFAVDKGYKNSGRRISHEGPGDLSRLDTLVAVATSASHRV
jgi:hypothetical protein